MTKGPIPGTPTKVPGYETHTNPQGEARTV